MNIPGLARGTERKVTDELYVKQPRAQWLNDRDGIQGDKKELDELKRAEFLTRCQLQDKRLT